MSPLALSSRGLNAGHALCFALRLYMQIGRRTTKTRCDGTCYVSILRHLYSQILYCQIKVVAPIHLRNYFIDSFAC